MAKTVRLIGLQFMVSEKYLRANPEILPGVQCVESETIQIREVRKERDTQHQSGTLLFPPTKRVDLAKLPGDLAKDYVLVGAKRQSRMNDRGSWDHTFRFVWVRREFFTPSEEFAQSSGHALASLVILCGKNMWRGQSFLNPFFADGVPVEGHAAVDINLKEREDVVDANCQPLMVWQKDEAGRRVGDTKVQLKPNFTLRLENDLPVLTAS